ncbi:MAG: ATPase V [Clostridia bacterium]|nr:ATPase V [Clostridia bacterium]
MSVEAMTMVTILGPEKLINTAIQKLVVNRDFHPESAIKLLSGVRALSPFDEPNPYSESLSKALAIAANMNIDPDYRDFTQQEILIEDVSEYLGALAEKTSAMKKEREEKELIVKNNKSTIEQLMHFTSFNVELNDLFSMKYLKFHFGRLPTEDYRDCMEAIDSRPDVHFVVSDKGEHWTYGAYFAFPEEYTQIESIFSANGFERIRIDVQGNVETTAQEVIGRLVSEVAQSEDRLGELEAQYEKIISAEREKLLVYYSWLRFMSQSFDIGAYAGRRHGRFYLIGWIPKRISEDYVKECEAYDGFACFLTEPREVKDTPPPVKFKKNFLAGIYQPFLEMYGLPNTGELDPRLFLAVTYTVIFGIMFGDVGQGLLIAALGFLLWKTKGVWLGRILTLCGLSGMCFGFVYGSVFGNEELIGGFHVLESGNTMKILLIAVALGVFLLLLCMILNIITGIRQRDIKKIFFEPNGLAGVVIYGGLAFAAAELLLFDRNIVTVPFILLVIVLPLFLIFSATPLSKLLTGQKDWMPESIGMFFIEGFFELFETLLSYVSNTISFLRIGAYAISHAGMMMVVYMLSANSGGESIFGLIIGNILIAALEAALVCIQIIRLEFYEMFGRFYTGGGRKFTPVEIDYKAAV